MERSTLRKLIENASKKNANSLTMDMSTLECLVGFQGARAEYTEKSYEG